MTYSSFSKISFNKIGDYNKSLEYCKKSHTIINNLTNKKANTIIDKDVEYCKNSLFIGATYQLLYRKNKTSQPTFKDSILYYYKKIIDFNSSNNQITSYKASTLSNVAGIYFKDSIYNKAQDYLKQAIEIHKKSNNTVALSNSLANISFMYMKEKNYKLAKKYTSEALMLIEKDTSESAMKNKAQVYHNFASILYNLKDYKAYKYEYDAYEINERLKNLEYKKAIETINAEHNVEVAKKMVRKEEEAKRQKATLVAWIIGLTSLFIIVTLLFLVYFYRLKQKNLKLIQKQNIEKLQSESELQVLQASIEATASERKRISQELHDGILGRLFGTRIGLGYLQCKGDEINKQQHGLFLEELQHIEKEIRDVSHKLSNNFDTDELTFSNVVNQLLKEKSYIGNFKFLLNNSKDIEWDSVSQQIKINLYRILQESLQNIIKHADAKKVTLNFSIDNKQLVVEIKDDGKGFSKTENNDGIGMKNIASRIKTIHGTLKVKSEDNLGTSIKISIPYEFI